VTYYGHGAENLWGQTGVFDETDAKGLNNTSLPIVVALNCLNNYYYDINSSSLSLGESFIFNPKGGSVAFWGSTSQTSPIAQMNLAKSFFNKLANDTNSVPVDLRLGDIILNAKQSLGDNMYSEDTVKSWTLFGDPALKIPEAAFAKKPQTNPTFSNDDNSGGGGCGLIKGSKPPGGPWSGLFMLLLMALPLLILRKHRVQ